MASYNKVILLGNLTRDPELRVTPKGTAICQFGMAMNRKWKTEGGQDAEEVCFVDCEAWGKTGEAIAKYLKKGNQIFVDGRLKLDQWEDKATAQKRSKLKVVVDTFNFVGPREAAPADESAERHTPPPARPEPKPAENLDEDVPF